VASLCGYVDKEAGGGTQLNAYADKRHRTIFAISNYRSATKWARHA